MIRFRFDPNKVRPMYVFYYTQLPSYSLWVSSIQRPSGQPNINAKEFKTLKIPVPSFKVQDQIIEIMESAYHSRLDNKRKAQQLLDSIDGYLMKELGVEKPIHEKILSFAIHKTDLSGKMNVESYANKHTLVCNTESVSLECVLDNDFERERPQAINGKVPYVGLPECSQTEVMSVAEREESDVRSRKMAVVGDVLFARIEPSIFNKKYVFVKDLKKAKSIYLSTEFHVLRTDKMKCNQEYLYHLLFTDFIFSQIAGKTTGSTGRRRLDWSELMKVKLPLPKNSIQKKIVEEITRKKEKASTLIQESENQIQQAKTKVEKILFSSS